VALVAVLVAGGVWWGTSGDQGNKPVKHTAQLPQSFGAYSLAKADNSAWTDSGTVNADPNKGHARITYRAAGGKALRITMDMDPVIKEEPGDEDTALSALFGTTVDSAQVKSYSAGTIGGKIKCATITILQSGYTQCAWQDSSARVTLAPVLNSRTVISVQAHNDLRSFLNALKISLK
jgi:hypothetical protein